jgi:hypothetical protein
MRDQIESDGFPCDEILASQWVDRLLPCFTDVPERRLLVAVLFDAVRALARGRRERAEVMAWIRGAFPTAPIQFDVLCDGLGLEATSLSRRLLLPVVPGAKPHRRVGVRKLTDGGRHIGIVARRGVAAAAPADPLAA